MRDAPVREGEILAAVDLGSNSFHMLVARFAHGQLTVIDRLREMVRLAAGLDSRDRLKEQSQAVALDCLRRFGERLRHIHADRVRVVGTNTLRRATNSARFAQRAGRALGHPVEIVSGIEEARLIWLGASLHLPRVDGPRLVADIGGGSTEIILGQGPAPVAMESLSVGCVSLTRECFPDGRLSARNFRAARLQARLELEPVHAQFLRARPAQVAGTSGTIRAAQAVLAAMSREPDAITIDGLEALVDAMVSAGHVERLRLPGLSRERAEVFPGGIAILIETMRALDLRRMVVSEGALREGILIDLVGRLTDEDARERTVRAMAARYHVDLQQAEQVAKTAGTLLKQVARAWELGDDQPQRLLDWAARLHELGLDIAHAQYHRHGAYVLANADMPGFTNTEQQVLATIVGNHRRPVDRSSFRELPREWRQVAFRLTVLLRLAVLFRRSRRAEPLPAIRLRAGPERLRLELPASWLEANPLTEADLGRERDLLRRSGVELVVARRRRS